MSTMRKFLILIASLLLAAFGIGLQIKAAIGLAPFDAFNQAIAYAFNFRVGDVVSFAQVLFVGLQVLILKKDVTWKLFLQVLVGALLGQAINLVLYTVLSGLVVEGYFMRLAFLVFGSLWAPFFIGAIMVLDLVTMPVESLAMLVAKKTGKLFGQIRQYIDIVFLILAVVITFISKEPFTIREGTIVSALTFGPLLNLYMPIIQKYFTKWHIIDPAE